MKIESEDRQSVVTLESLRAELTAYPSICVSIELRSRHVSGEDPGIWIELDKVNNFIEALTLLDRVRKGEALLEGMSPGELWLRIYPLNSRGHIGLEIKINGKHFVGDDYMNHGCHTSFQLEPTALPGIREGLRILINEQKAV